MIETGYQLNVEKNMISMGDFEFHLLMDGYYRLDAGAMYGMVPRTVWEKIENIDEKNRIYMQMNCLLAKRGERIYLTDAGIGRKLDAKGRDIFGIEGERTLMEEMALAGVAPEDVTHVILTHLHFDHAGWIQDDSGNLTFPNAFYYVQKAEWEEARNPHVRFKSSYLKNYYSALDGSPRLILLDGSGKIGEGVEVILTPGHSRGHQVVLFDSGCGKIAHAGDMVALSSLIRRNWTCGFDRAPEEAMDSKAPVIDRALKEKWLMVTAHDRNIRIGAIEEINGKTSLRKIL